jgi:hypothetical protein
MWSHCEGSDI